LTFIFYKISNSINIVTEVSFRVFFSWGGSALFYQFSGLASTTQAHARVIVLALDLLHGNI